MYSEYYPIYTPLPLEGLGEVSVWGFTPRSVAPLL